MAPLPYVSICSGGGGLDRGVHAALVGAGHAPRCVMYCEREAFAAAHLVAEMEAGRLDPAPIWSDCTAVPAGVREHLRRLAGRHPLGLVGGIPCQPFSAAGKREGLEDERWIWPAVFDLIRDCGMGWCCVENVPGFVRAGLPVVAGDLASLGWSVEWSTLRASEVGAPHRRERVFIVGISDAFSMHLRDERGRGEAGTAEAVA